jgi:GR25 family glycosyltransferase involved in LPS biosynthesis
MVDKIYVIHLEKLSERKNYIESLLKDIKIPVEFIVSNSESDKELIDNYKTFYYKYDKNKFDRILSDSEICVSIMHFKVYEDILNNNINTSLIIEDDAIFTDYFFKYIKEISLRDDYDMCFISECCNLHKNKNEDQILYDSETSRCTSGYIVKKNKLKEVVESIPFNYPIDWHLNMIRSYLDLKFKWSEPCLIKQGSEFIYKSNLR